MSEESTIEARTDVFWVDLSEKMWQVGAVALIRQVRPKEFELIARTQHII